MYGLLQDARHSLRSLLATPGFSAVAVATIAVGIGATTAIFSVVQAVLLQPLPYAEPERLVFVRGELENRGVFNWPISPRILLDMRERVQSVPELGGVFTFTETLIDREGQAARVSMAGVTPNLLALIGVRPALGRDFRADDAAPIADDAETDPPTAVILSHDSWQRHFGGDPNIVGSFIGVFGDRVEVVGVTEPDFQLLLPPDSRWATEVDVWFTPRVDLVNYDRRQAMFEVIGRLADGATVAWAQAEVDAVVAFLHEISESSRGAGYDLRVVPMHEDVTAEVRPVVVALLGTVVFVLLIACANVASLLLVRSSTRVTDTAVRAALGADRLRLVRRLLTESALLAVMGGAGGVILAHLGIGGLLALGPPEFPRMETVGIDTTVLGFTLVATTVAALLFGLVPAWRASRTDVAEILKHGGRSAAGSRSALRTGIVTLEVALSVVLLIGAGLMMRSFVELQRADPGFDTDSALTFEIELDGYRQAERRAFTADLRARLESLPGVESVSGATMLPLTGASGRGRYGTREALNDDALYGQADYRYVLEGYFATMGTRVLEGRVFDESDFAGDGTATAVVDELAARRLWPNESPVGETLVIRRGPEPELLEVIGVVEHQRSRSPAFDSQETVYFNASRVGNPGTTQWIVRTPGAAPEGLAPQVRAELAAMDPMVVVTGMRSLRQVVWEVMAPTRFALVLMSIFAAIAVFLASLGVYGVLAYTVRQRRPEIGLRMVFGAPTRSILCLVVRQGITPAVGGVLLGLIAAVWLSRGLSSLLVEVPPTDPATYAGTAVLFLLIAAVASLVPASFATRIDPMEALRRD